MNSVSADSVDTDAGAPLIADIVGGNITDSSVQGGFPGPRVENGAAAEEMPDPNTMPAWMFDPETDPEVKRRWNPWRSARQLVQRDNGLVFD